MNIRRMQESDLEQVVELEKACFQNPWNHSQCLYELNENPFSKGFLIQEEDRIVGYAFLWVTFEIAQLARIGIDPMYRKKGYGQFLLDQLMQYAREKECEFLTLEVRASNIAGQKLYERAGLIQVNRSASYYPDGEDALVLSCAL